MQLRRPFLVRAVLVVVLGLIGAGIAIWLGREDSETAPLDPYPHSSFRIVALGDSYISGQGTRRYYAGTDEPGRNMCHRAARAYPHLLAEHLKASLVFPACSGAETADVLDRGQYPASGEADYGEVYGARPQIEILEEIDDFDVVLISIGGNDAGFEEIGKQCLRLRNCGDSEAEWLRHLETTVSPALIRTYARVKEAAEGTPVFAMTYPNPLGRKYCDKLVGIEPKEWDFLNLFVKKLNKTVRGAARAAQIKWIALERALVKHRFCETKRVAEAAINFIRVRIGSGQRIIHFGDVQESLHPNEEGHRLMEAAVLPRIEALPSG
jgi:lysophospholipase L1-like esterase